jgi:hypothetical protein
MPSFAVFDKGDKAKFTPVTCIMFKLHLVLVFTTGRQATSLHENAKEKILTWAALQKRFFGKEGDGDNCRGTLCSPRREVQLGVSTTQKAGNSSTDHRFQSKCHRTNLSLGWRI